jgi:hypothetical protein
LRASRPRALDAALRLGFSIRATALREFDMTDKNSAADRTITQTVWSESVLDPLVAGLKEGKDDEWIKAQLASIEKRAQIPVRYLIQRAAEDLGPEYAERLREAAGEAAQEPPHDAEPEASLLDRFLGLLRR